MLPAPLPPYAVPQPPPVSPRLLSRTPLPITGSLSAIPAPPPFVAGAYSASAVAPPPPPSMVFSAGSSSMPAATSPRSPPVYDDRPTRAVVESKREVDSAHRQLKDELQRARERESQLEDRLAAATEDRRKASRVSAIEAAQEQIAKELESLRVQLRSAHAAEAEATRQRHEVQMRERETAGAVREQKRHLEAEIRRQQDLRRKAEKSAAKTNAQLQMVRAEARQLADEARARHSQLEVELREQQRQMADAAAMLSDQRAAAIQQQQRAAREEARAATLEREVRKLSAISKPTRSQSPPAPQGRPLASQLRSEMDHLREELSEAAHRANALAAERDQETSRLRNELSDALANAASAAEELQKERELAQTRAVSTAADVERYRADAAEARLHAARLEGQLLEARSRSPVSGGGNSGSQLDPDLRSAFVRCGSADLRSAVAEGASPGRVAAVLAGELNELSALRCAVSSPRSPSAQDLAFGVDALLARTPDSGDVSQSHMSRLAALLADRDDLRREAAAREERMAVLQGEVAGADRRCRDLEEEIAAALRCCCESGCGVVVTDGIVAGVSRLRSTLEEERTKRSSAAASIGALSALAERGGGAELVNELRRALPTLRGDLHHQTSSVAPLPPGESAKPTSPRRRRGTAELSPRHGL